MKLLDTWLSLPVGAIAVVTLAVACAPGAPNGQQQEQPQVPAYVVLEYAVPVESVEDAVSYTDSLAVVLVTNEMADKPPTKYADITRVLTLAVKQRLWQAPGGAVPGEIIESRVLGWTNDEDRRPLAVADRARLEVGETYMLSLMQVDCHWVVVDSTVVGVDAQGKTVKPDISSGTSLAKELTGAGVSGSKKLLEQTPANPVAAANQSLDPDARFQEVVKVRDNKYDLSFRASPERDC